MEKEDNINNFDNFYNLMHNKIIEHNRIYGDSWKEMSLGKLHDRLKLKMSEFDLTFNRDKLISVANLAMLLYIRMREENEKKMQTPRL